MQKALLALAVVGALLAPAALRADIYKYVDAKGNTYFTDSPLSGDKYRLQWKRGSRNLVAENERRLALALHTEVPNRTLSARRSRIERLVEAVARRYGLSAELLHAVIRTESAYDRSAVSSAGAQGLMQLMPATAARYGVKDSFDPVQNVLGGAAYLRDLLDMFDQDLKLALAGYNAGENAVIRNGYRIPPYPETEDYVRTVLKHLWSQQGSSRAAVLSVRRP